MCPWFREPQKGMSGLRSLLADLEGFGETHRGAQVLCDFKRFRLDVARITAGNDEEQDRERKERVASTGIFSFSFFFRVRSRSAGRRPKNGSPNSDHLLELAAVTPAGVSRPIFGQKGGRTIQKCCLIFRDSRLV